MLAAHWLPCRGTRRALAALPRDKSACGRPRPWSRGQRRSGPTFVPPSAPTDPRLAEVPSSGSSAHLHSCFLHSVDDVAIICAIHRLPNMSKIDVHAHIVPPAFRKALDIHPDPAGWRVPCVVFDQGNPRQQSLIFFQNHRDWTPEGAIETQDKLNVRTSVLSVSTPGTLRDSRDLSMIVYRIADQAWVDSFKVASSSTSKGIGN